MLVSLLVLPLLLLVLVKVQLEYIKSNIDSINILFRLKIRKNKNTYYKMSSPITLYLSPQKMISQAVLWLANKRNVQYQLIYVSRLDDMTDIKERNPENKIPVLKHGELILTNVPTIVNYLLSYGTDNLDWGCLKANNDPVLSAKISERVSYYDSILNPTIKSYLMDIQKAQIEGICDPQYEIKLKAVLEEMDQMKKRQKFFACDSLTVVDLLYLSAIHLIENTNIFHQMEESLLIGWYRVCRKILSDEWENEALCQEDYEIEPDEEDFIVAETIMEAVKENRPDILENLAKQGYNINMPLAVIEAINRNNLFVLKVMRDNDCFLKWPMAISQAMRLSKPEDILALLIDPNLSKEDLIKEAKAILKQENDKMKEVLGPEYEEYLKQQKENKPEIEQVRNNTIMEGVFATSKFVFFEARKAPYSLEFLRAFKIGEEVYKSVMEYLLCEKANYFGNQPVREQIKNSNNIDEQLKLGEDLGEDLEWLKRETEVVVEATIAKFQQHKDLLHILLQIGDKTLAQTGKNETYWGIGLDTMNLDSQKKDKWTGKNKAGEVLMTVREQLISQDDTLKQMASMTC
jgi:ribA/ribD-fused uncharacterized protein